LQGLEQEGSGFGLVFHAHFRVEFKPSVYLLNPRRCWGFHRAVKPVRCLCPAGAGSSALPGGWIPCWPSWDPLFLEGDRSEINNARVTEICLMLSAVGGRSEGLAPRPDGFCAGESWRSLGDVAGAAVPAMRSSKQPGSCF